MGNHEVDLFTAIWTASLELHGKSASDAATLMAFDALQNYSLDDVRRALAAHTRDPVNGRFPPKPADLILHMDGDPESRALQSWTKVESAISSVGPYPSVVFDDPRIMIAIEDMGGWVSLCEMQYEELPFKRNEFVNRYKGYLNRPADRFPPKLLGLTELSNQAKYSDFIQPPKLIGDPKLALEVLRGGQKQQPRITSLGDLTTKVLQQFKQPEQVKELEVYLHEFR